MDIKYLGRYNKAENSRFFEHETNKHYVISCERAKDNKPALVDYNLSRGEQIVAYLSLDCNSLKHQSQVILNATMITDNKSLNRSGGTPKPRKGSYESMTVAQLKERCAKRGIKGYSSLRKADLIAALRK